MAPITKRKDGLLARVNFPLYTLQMLTSRHILVAGGGGSSKTGVANGFEVFELSHDGQSYIAEEVVRHETGSSVVMNCAASTIGSKCFLVAGQESHCQLYKVLINVVNDDDIIENISADKKPKVRHRRTSESKSKSNNQEEKKKKDDINLNSFGKLSIEFKTGDSIQTDFTKHEPLQRVARINHSGKLMATGGTDGHVRLWAFPSMLKKIDIPAHTKEIDDIDFSPDDSMIFSIGKDGFGILWNPVNGEKINQLQWTTPNNTKYLFKRCRFGRREKPDKCNLFTISNPLARTGKCISFLQIWDPAAAKLKGQVQIPENLSALSVSPDGLFVAVGTMFSGSVSIYTTFRLQRVLHIPQAHSMFVTGLEFIPNVLEDPSVPKSIEVAVVSISVDNHVCIHTVNQRSTMPMWLAVVLIIATLFLTFLLCSYLQL